MRILIVKTSSLGDVVHMFPAVSDMHSLYPSATIDWVVEEAFAELPCWHHFVQHNLSFRPQREILIAFPMMPRV